MLRNIVVKLKIKAKEKIFKSKLHGNFREMPIWMAADFLCESMRPKSSAVHSSIAEKKRTANHKLSVKTTLQELRANNDILKWRKNTCKSNYAISLLDPLRDFS